jgi:hypothetical protein
MFLAGAHVERVQGVRRCPTRREEVKPPAIGAELLAFEIAELVVGIAAAALQQEPVIAAVHIDAPQLVRPRLSGAELVGLVMPTAAAAALPRVKDESAARRQHGIDIHLRCRELGCAAGALDENASSIAVNARRLTVRGDRARQQSKEGQNR